MTSFWQHSSSSLFLSSAKVVVVVEVVVAAAVAVAARWCPDVLIKFWTWREIASSNFVVWFCFARKFFCAISYTATPLAVVIWIISCKLSWVERQLVSQSQYKQATKWPPPREKRLSLPSLSPSWVAAASFLFGQLQIRINFLDVPIYLAVYERSLMKTEHGHDSLARTARAA